jgi:hypothetical protein
MEELERPPADGLPHPSIAEGNCRSICLGLSVASIAAACIFAFTYCRGWTEFRPFVAVGRSGLDDMQICWHTFDWALKTYHEGHGCYPDAIREAFPLDEDMTHYVDPWKRPYQYSKTGSGFRLFSLGRDGKAGGIGLDSDSDLFPMSEGDIPITLSQFLFDGAKSETLFGIALWVSLGAWLTCFSISVLPTQSQRNSWVRSLVWALLITAAAIYLAECLMDGYLAPSGLV